ncbi:MAG: THUMP-like domain-containing protein, partial [Cyclobacteriaceae bacterium]
LKAGPFKLMGQRFGLTKLDVNTHFYTSAERQTHFPGRIFEVVTPLKLDKHVSAQFEGQQANIISRNHPLSVAEICRKTQLTEGGTEYVLAFRAGGKPMTVKAIRIQ